MGQLYSRIFLQILDSSIAEDYRVRHIFEDLLKICDYKTGNVDITRQGLSRRLNIPIDEINRAIGILESPDTDSRDPSHGGRRIQRLDDTRDWGWVILNWDKYEGIRGRGENAERVSKHRSKPLYIDDEKFAIFWEAYPRKVCKCDAMRAFSKDGVPDVSVLVAALDIQKKCQQWLKDDGQFIPHPATWLNQERWTDQLPAKSTKAPNGKAPNPNADIFAGRSKIEMIEKEVKRLNDAAPMPHHDGYLENQSKIKDLRKQARTISDQLIAS